MRIHFTETLASYAADLCCWRLI